MKLEIPKDFFESLSEKTQKELEDKASKYEYLCYDERRDTLWPSRHYDSIVESTQSFVKVKKLGLFLNKYQDKDKFQRLFELEKQVEEFNRLKNSLENLKGFIK